jgi:hypothetical protein
MRTAEQKVKGYMAIDRTVYLYLGMRRLALLLLFIILPLMFAQCSKYPTESSGRDLAEQESVWQYLKTYSIYQDTCVGYYTGPSRVPANAFVYGSSEAMLDSVHDTLSGGGYPINTYTGTYTGYDYDDIYSSSGTASITYPYRDTTVYWVRVRSSLADSTGYLGISQFDSYTYYEFSQFIDSLNSCKNIIFDLRDNTGGDLTAVDSIVQNILPGNTKYIQERCRTYDSDKRVASTQDWTTLVSTIYHSNFKNKRIVVLTNRYTASAAEFMAAALKDGYKGSHSVDTVTLVGDTTYGKGMGQIIIPRQVWGKTNLKITFLFIKGVKNRTGAYHRKGIVPDIVSPSHFSSDSIAIEAAYTNQLLAALRVINPSATFSKTRQEITTAQSMLRRALKHSTPEAYIIASPDKLPIRR